MPNDGPTSLERFWRGILPENPVYRQLLGMCPTLAVTTKMDNAMTMAAAVAFVLICANVIVSLIRGLLKPHLRILVFTLTIATFVTIADRLLQAFLFDMSRQLAPSSNSKTVTSCASYPPWRLMPATRLSNPITTR